MSSNNDFFSSFDASGQPQQRRKPVPPPRRPAAPPNASSAKTASAGASASYYASSSSSRPTATSLRPQPPAPPANRPAPRQPAAPSYYSSSAAPPQPAPTATAASTSANDWYTPSAATANTVTTAAPSPAAAAVMNPYATSAYGGGASSANNNSNIGNSNTAMQNNNYASNTMMGMNTNTNMNMNMNANQTGMDFNQNNNPSFSSSAALEGSMDSGAATFSNTAAAPTMSMFNPAAAAATKSTNQSTNSNTYSDDYDFENEPPLLEELGINLNHIWLKTKAVVVPSKRLSGNNSALVMDPKLIVQDADLAGPLAFALLLGCELLLTVKLSFGYIYGFGLAGCCSMTLILNLMSPTQPVNFWTVTSILGYGLLPVNVLAAYKIIVQQITGLETLTRALALLTILWSTTASTRLLEVGCGMDKQRYLMAYPIAMLYTAFVLITIF